MRILLGTEWQVGQNDGVAKVGMNEKKLSIYENMR
jgi:hypothetical protein